MLFGIRWRHRQSYPEDTLERIIELRRAGTVESFGEQEICNLDERLKVFELVEDRIAAIVIDDS